MIKFVNKFAVVCASLIFLTACGGPDENDCTSAINEALKDLVEYLLCLVTLYFLQNWKMGD